MKRSERERLSRAVARARSLLPDLPTEELYRLNALLEKALSAKRLDPTVIDDLERALPPPARRRRAHQPKS